MVRHFLRDTYYTTREFSENARLFLLSTFLSWMGFSVNQVIFNLYLVEGGFQEAFVGQTVAMVGLGMGICALPAGFLSDLIGRRLSLLVGSAGVGLCLLFRSLTLDPAALLGFSFFLGAFNTLVSIAASPFMSENSESHVRTHLFSTHFVVVLLAGVVGNYGGGRVPEILVGDAVRTVSELLGAYRWALVGGAVATLLALWPLIFVREKPPIEDPTAPPADWRASRGPIAKLALNYLLIGSGAGLIMPFFNLYFANRFQCTSGQIGFFFAVSQVITVGAALAGPWLARRYGMLRTVTWLQLASLPFLVTLGFERHLWIAVIAFWARASLMQTSSPLQNAFAMEVVPPALRSRTTGVVNTAWNLGWALTASISGWILTNVGYAYPYYGTALLYGLAAVTFYRLFRRDPSTAAAESLRGDYRNRTSRDSALEPSDDSVTK